MLLDAVDLVLVDMGVVCDKGELAGFCADDLSDKITENGVLRNVKGETERNVGGTGSNEKVEVAIDEVPLGVPDAAWQGRGGEPFVLPEAHNHAAVAGVFP